MSEVDDISQGLGKELRGLFAAALALAQIAAQRRAAQVREQAADTGVAAAEARRRFDTEQRTAALGIALPEAGMTPQQVAQSWAQADVARAHAPEVAELWDAQARTVGVDPDEVRAQWWREQGGSTREDPGAYRVAMTGLGAEGAAVAADADRAQAQDLEEAAGRERRAGSAGSADTRDELDADTTAGSAPTASREQEQAAEVAVQAGTDAQRHDDRADTLDARAADADGTAHRLEAGAPGDERSVPASPGVWQDGHPSARLAGKAYGVPLGRGTTPARRRSRSGGQGMAAAKQREHGLDR